MPSERRPEVILSVRRPGAVRAFVGRNERLIPLSDVGIDGVCAADGIVVVAGGDHGVRRPALDQVGDIARGGDLRVRRVIPDHRQPHRTQQPPPLQGLNFVIE